MADFRVLTPSFLWIEGMWACRVRRLMKSCSAACGSLSPPAASLSTSTSRGVNPAGSSGAGTGVPSCSARTCPGVSAAPLQTSVTACRSARCTLARSQAHLRDPALGSRHPTYVQKSLGHASVQLTLDRYSHWMPSMGRNTAEGIDEALG